MWSYAKVLFYKDLVSRRNDVTVSVSLDGIVDKFNVVNKSREM